MTDKTQQFTRAGADLMTLGTVMSRLNTIAKTAGGDFASYSKNITDFDGNIVSGFHFSSHEMASKLGRLLSDLGIKYANVYDSIKSEAGRLEIAPEHKAHADKIFDNWQSNVVIEPRITGNAALDAKWRTIANVTR